MEDVSDVIHDMSKERYASYGEHRCISVSQSQTKQRLNFPSAPTPTTNYNLKNQTLQFSSQAFLFPVTVCCLSGLY